MHRRTARVVFSLWLVAATLVFALMLLHRSDPASVLGRYSTTYALSLGVVLLTLLPAGIGVWLAQRDSLPSLPTVPQSVIVGGVGLSLVGLVVFWVFMPGATYLPAIALFRVYVAALLGGGILYYLHQQRNHLRALPASAWTLTFLAGAGIAVLLTVLYIGEVPASRYYDEPLVANYGWTCVQRGDLGVAMLPPRDTAYLKVALPLTYCLPGFLMQWFGTTLTVARMGGIGLVWLAAPLVYLTATRLYDRTAALTAALLMLLFPLAHNFLRSDPYVPLALSIALYAYVRGREEGASLLWHGVTGFALSTTIEGHQLGVRFIPVFGVLYLWHYAQAVRAGGWHLPRAALAWTIGGFCYAGIYYGIHIHWMAGTDLAGMFQLIDTAYDEQLAVGGNVGFWQRLADVTRLWFTEYVVLHPAEFLVLVVSVAAALWRRLPADKLLLTIAALSWVLYVLINPKHTPYYWVHHLPLIALLAGGFVASLRERTSTAPTLRVLFPLVFVLTFYTAHILDSAQTRQNADRVMDISFDIAAHLPPELDVITGHQVYFYGLAEREFYDLNTFAQTPVEEAVQRWEMPPPQAVVLTSGLDEHPTILAYMEAQSMQVVRCYQTNFFGGRTYLYVLPTFTDAVESRPCEAS